MADAKHWDEVYTKKSEREVSWYQEVPAKSLELITELNLAPHDPIIDIGGGDSHLVDHLLSMGFEDISVLDISAKALEKTKARLGEKAPKVKLIVSDVTRFEPAGKYKLWHDRAAFHFITSREEVESYLSLASQAILTGGYLIVSTFSKTGPEKCSGLQVSQYSDQDLKKMFARNFTDLRCFEDTHGTPWGAKQNFIYCGFKKR